MAKLLIVIGLILNILGVGLLTLDLILTKAEATELAAFHLPSDEKHEKRRGLGRIDLGAYDVIDSNSLERAWSGLGAKNLSLGKQI